MPHGRGQWEADVLTASIHCGSAISPKDAIGDWSLAIARSLAFAGKDAVGSASCRCAWVGQRFTPGPKCQVRVSAVALYNPKVKVQDIKSMYLGQKAWNGVQMAHISPLHGQSALAPRHPAASCTASSSCVR